MTNHNEFVSKVIIKIGPSLLAQGSRGQQLVAVESLLAGLIGLIANVEGASILRAETYLRAVVNGAVKRLPTIIPQSSSSEK